MRRSKLLLDELKLNAVFSLDSTKSVASNDFDN